MHKVADALEVPFTQVMQIASFYKTFSLTPKGRHEVHVCTGMTCHLRGAAKLLEKVEELTGLKPGETDAGSRFTLATGACLGSCSIGPGTDRRRQALRPDDARQGRRRSETLRVGKDSMARLQSAAELEELRAKILASRDPARPCIAVCAGAACDGMDSAAVAAAFLAEVRQAEARRQARRQDHRLPRLLREGTERRRHARRHLLLRGPARGRARTSSPPR